MHELVKSSMFDRFSQFCDIFFSLTSIPFFFCHISQTVDVYRQRISSGDRYVHGESSALYIMFLSLLFVLTVYSVLYVHYIREPKYETWVPITRLNLLRRSVAFARFDNRPNEDGNGTIDVGIRYDSSDEAEEKPVNDFNNPMYEQVTLGSVETEMLQPSATSTSTDEAGTLSTDIKLVDISLNAIDESNQNL